MRAWDSPHSELRHHQRAARRLAQDGVPRSQRPLKNRSEKRSDSLSCDPARRRRLGWRTQRRGHRGPNRRNKHSLQAVCPVTPRFKWSTANARQRHRYGYQQVPLPAGSCERLSSSSTCLPPRSFTLATIDRTVNADWFSSVAPSTPQQDAMKALLRQGDGAALNLYTTGFESGSARGLLGFSTYP